MVQDVDHWKEYDRQDAPNMFANLKLAHDGGFSEVKDLYDVSRWVSAGMLVVFVIYNVAYLGPLDYGFIKDPNHVEGYTTEQIAKINNTFFFSATIYHHMFKLLNMCAGYEVWKIGSLKPVQVLGFLELIGLIVYICLAIWSVVDMIFGKGKRRWFAVANLFWNWLPVLSVYSAMRLLDKVVPSVAIANFTAEVSRAGELKALGKTPVQAFSGVIALALKTAACFLVGFDVFLLRMRVVNINLSKPDVTLADFSACILLLVQMLGVVQLGPFVRQRLFVFIFAGEDGIMQEDERDKMETWNALLARRIYREFSFTKFLAVVMSFTDEDFQKLVLNEDAIAKGNEPAKKA